MKEIKKQDYNESFAFQLIKVEAKFPTFKVSVRQPTDGSQGIAHGEKNGVCLKKPYFFTLLDDS